jgi:hypothetical protein
LRPKRAIEGVKHGIIRDNLRNVIIESSSTKTHKMKQRAPMEKSPSSSQPNISSSIYPKKKEINLIEKIFSSLKLGLSTKRTYEFMIINEYNKFYKQMSIVSDYRFQKGTMVSIMRKEQESMNYLR